MINRFLYQTTFLFSLVLFGFSTLENVFAHSFEMAPGLWQIKSTVAKTTPFDGDTEASEYQLKCVDEKDKNILFRMLEEAFDGINQAQVYNADRSCKIQDDTNEHQMKVTASCKIPGQNNYVSYLLVQNFNNQHQYVARVHSEHPNGIMHNIRINLFFLGSCIERE